MSTYHEEVSEFLAQYKIQARANQLCKELGLHPLTDKEKSAKVVEAMSKLGLAVALEEEDFGIEQ